MVLIKRGVLKESKAIQSFAINERIIDSGSNVHCLSDYSDIRQQLNITNKDPHEHYMLY